MNKNKTLMPNESEFRRKLSRSTVVIIFALGIPLIILLALVFFLLNSAKWLDHSYQIIAEANHEERLLITMQSNFHGYRLMKDKAILEDYFKVSREIDRYFITLQNLVIDNPKQEALAKEFQAKTDQWIKMSQNFLDQMTDDQSAVSNAAYLQSARAVINDAVSTGETFINKEEQLRLTRENLLENVTTTILGVFAVLIIGGIPVLVLWLQRQLKGVSGLYQASLMTTERRAGELEVTLNSIGDAVVATNAKGKVEFLNPVAEKLTGWTNADARGRDLIEIFQIFNEHTRLPVENPVERVLKENIIVGLANHTVLRAKDGRELPIEDSAAPIRNQQNEVLGVILVFHDVTVKRAEERKLADAEWRSRNALEVGGAGSWIWEISKDRVTGDAMVARTFGVALSQCNSGEPMASFINAVHNDDRLIMDQALRNAVQTGEAFECEYRVIGENAIERWVHVRGKIQKTAAGQPEKILGFLIDITERKNSEHALAEANQRFRLLTELVEMQVWTAKPNGELDYANQRCAEYFNADIERDILGNAWAQFVHPDDWPAVSKKWQKCLATGEPYEIEFRLKAGNGEFRWFLVRAKAVRDAEGRITNWFGTNTDIHALKMAQNEATQGSRAKDNFLAALSHELRTPLTPVLMTASALHEDDRLPADVREQIGMMERNIVLEARLIDDLLDLTTISRGKLKLRSQLCDVHSLIALAIEIVRDDALTKNISIERDLSARQSGLIADPARFQQVIWNLLRNAVKFTPKGGQVLIRTRDKDVNCLEVEVIDSGIGIPSGSLEKIFLPFEQVSIDGKHNFGGVGLGLAIAHAIVELHHGTIKASSAGPNHGATFTVKLPGATIPPHGASDTTIHSSILRANNADGKVQKQDGAPFRLLLVEDHGPTLQVISTLLRRDGYYIATATTVTNAMAVAASDTFDLVISDLGLPDGSGIQLMQMLRNKNSLKGVALTGYGMEEDIARCHEAGFVAHIIKPVQIAELRRIIRNQLDKQG